MAQKACVVGIANLALNGSTYELRVAAVVTVDDQQNIVNVTATATASQFVPLVPPWRTRIRDAVIAAAMADHSIEVDQVMFPDFGVLGI